MAKTMGYAMFCVLLVLASLMQYGQTSSVHVFNGGEDMSIQNTIEYYNGTIRTEAAQAVLKNTIYELEVVPGIICVHTWYTMGVTGSVPEHQYLPSWCTMGMAIFCNDCYWVVDSTGFSVASSSHATLKHVANWRS